MFYNLIAMLLDIAASLVAGACLLRLLMQWQRVSFRQPIGQFVCAVTDWLVLPLRRHIPAWGKLDTASVVGAWLIKAAQFGLMWALMGGHGALGLLPLVSVVGLAQLVVSALSALVFLYVLMSWLQPGSTPYHLLQILSQPFLDPLRNRLPRLGGVDISAWLFMTLMQVLAMVLAGLQNSWLM
jgi:YggT family protein